MIVSHPENKKNEESATLTSLVQAAVTTLTMQPSFIQSMAALPLTAGDQVRNYTITETIVQGWLYEKGTGEIGPVGDDGSHVR